MKIFRNLLVTFIFFIFGHNSVASNSVETEKKIDLNLYLGKWYEIAAIPQSFQKQCVKNTTAEYGLTDDDMIKVINSCDKNDGSRSVAEGRARVVDKSTNSKLEVTFVKLFDWIFSFGGDYWILKVGENYEYSIVGHPNRKYAWILSRTPALSLEQLERINSVLENNGYDTCLLLMSPQEPGYNKRDKLCEYVNQE
ncbi:MAG: lipocalin family protein [Bdellovibrionales bacterium]|nr:lipocalin family protein [Bdellovibrionales bacterium]